MNLSLTLLLICVMLLIVIIIVHVISFVSAQIVVTRPTHGSIYTAGETGLIIWRWEDGVTPQEDALSIIELRRKINDNGDHIVIGIIAENVDLNDGGYIWSVPADITVFGQHYDVVFSSPSLPSSYASAGYFSIEAPHENATSSVASTSTASDEPATSSSTVTESTSGPKATSPTPDEKSEGNSAGVIAGAVVGGAVGFGLIVGAIALYCIRKRRQARIIYENELNEGYSDGGKDPNYATEFIPPYFTESEQNSKDAVHSLSAYHTNQETPKVVYTTTSDKTEVSSHPNEEGASDVPRYRMTPVN
ncbi:hypothetical protein BJV82DRAFT_617928, partial [Fennellomyces sp. T-0311]